MRHLVMVSVPGYEVRILGESSDETLKTRQEERGGGGRETAEVEFTNL